MEQKIITKRQEEIKEMARITASHITSDKDMQVAFADALRRGAEWADEHPVSYDDKAMLYVNNRSHENGYKEAVNKACEWIERNYHATPMGGYYYLPEDCIEQFKQAMKGE